MDFKQSQLSSGDAFQKIKEMQWVGTLSQFVTVDYWKKKWDEQTLNALLERKTWSAKCNNTLIFREPTVSSEEA